MIPESDPPTRIQLGFPEPPQPGGDTSFEIMKLWLEDCNTRDPHGMKHQDCHTQGGSIPTRLIDVGTLMSPKLRLVDTREDAISHTDYIALSHPWGDTKKYPPFCTLRSNIDALKQFISYDDLPATFKDAVYCTRKLNIPYLWIDSICIIQGDGGDFNSESKRMEDVFSGAYCVLAASRATSQRDGFLGPRPTRSYVTFHRGGEKPFYVSKTIDNFNKDVIEGSLNKRGWVLQERALARRTIYFTENQTYFECGDGIRCQTLTKMRKYEKGLHPVENVLESTNVLLQQHGRFPRRPKVPREIHACQSRRENSILPRLIQTILASQLHALRRPPLRDRRLGEETTERLWDKRRLRHLRRRG
jgi:hypothetical protein